MTGGAAVVAAVKETGVFRSHFEDLPAAALARAETVADIARFGRANSTGTRLRRQGRRVAR